MVHQLPRLQPAQHQLLLRLPLLRLLLHQRQLPRQQRQLLVVPLQRLQLLQPRLLRLRQRSHRQLQQPQRQHLLHVQVRHQDPAPHRGLALLRRRGPDAQ